jgi:hypothetical protein
VVMEKPATRASPDVGGNSVVSILMVVAPLEPSRPKTSPALTASVFFGGAVQTNRELIFFVVRRR